MAAESPIVAPRSLALPLCFWRARGSNLSLNTGHLDRKMLLWLCQFLQANFGIADKLRLRCSVSLHTNFSVLHTNRFTSRLEKM